MSATTYRVIYIVFLLALITAPPAQAADAAAAFTYIEPQTLPPMLLPPPPAEGSAAWRRQIARVLAVQAHIPAADRAAMRDEQRVRIESISNVIGDDFTRDHYPETFAMLDRVLTDTGLIVEADKRYWHTRRPYLTDHRVWLLIDPLDKSPAYPSGHTAEAQVLAEVLGMLYPEKLADLRARAAAIAQHRIEAGVHYPVDIAGGETLAAMIIGALMQDDGFQSDLAGAEAETKPAQ